MGLQLDGKIEKPHAEFDNERVRYEHRFSPFNSVCTPPMVHYDQFLKMTQAQSEVTPKDFFLEASRFFGQAKTLFESLPGYKVDQVSFSVLFLNSTFSIVIVDIKN